MTKPSTRRNSGRLNRLNSKPHEYTPRYSIRDLHELLDLVIDRGGRQAVEDYLEKWLCGDVETGLQMID
jgi:hypothetical protein